MRRSMEHVGCGLYIMGIGAPEDYDAGYGPLYLEERGDELALPVFFSLEALERYAEDNAADGSQSEPETLAELRAGRFRVIAVEGMRELVEIAVWSEADYLSWNPTPREAVQQIYRIPK
jgi:hypothetical protein